MWPFRSKPEPVTPGRLLARSMLHPDTEPDWEIGTKYPYPIRNQKLGVTLEYCSIFGRMKADSFDLTPAEERDLIGSFKELRRLRADRQKANEFERIVTAFEKTLGTNPET